MDNRPVCVVEATIAYFVTFGEKRGLDIPIQGKPQPLSDSAGYVRVNLALTDSAGYVRVNLALTDSEHFGAAYRAHTLGCWFAILHGYTLRILHLPLSAALYTISLHLSPPSRSLY